MVVSPPTGYWWAGLFYLVGYLPYHTIVIWLFWARRKTHPIAGRYPQLVSLLSLCMSPLYIMAGLMLVMPDFPCFLVYWSAVVGVVLGLFIINARCWCLLFQYEITCDLMAAERARIPEPAVAPVPVVVASSLAAPTVAEATILNNNNSGGENTSNGSLSLHALPQQPQTTPSSLTGTVGGSISSNGVALTTSGHSPPHPAAQPSHVPPPSLALTVPPLITSTSSGTLLASSNSSGGSPTSPLHSLGSPLLPHHGGNNNNNGNHSPLSPTATTFTGGGSNGGWSPASPQPGGSHIAHAPSFGAPHPKRYSMTSPTVIDVQPTTTSSSVEAAVAPNIPLAPPINWTPNWYTEHRDWMTPRRVMRGAIVLGFLTLVFLLGTIPIANIPDGCNVSESNDLFRNVSFGAICVIVALGLVPLVIMTYRIRKHDVDGFGLKAEFLYTERSTAIVVSSAIIGYFTIDSYQQLPFIVTMCLVACMFIHHWTNTVPLWASYKIQRSAQAVVRKLEGGGGRIEDVLALPAGFAAYFEFARREFASEGLLFIQHVRDYNKIVVEPYTAASVITQLTSPTGAGGGGGGNSSSLRSQLAAAAVAAANSNPNSDIETETMGSGTIARQPTTSGSSTTRGGQPGVLVGGSAAGAPPASSIMSPRTTALTSSGSSKHRAPSGGSGATATLTTPANGPTHLQRLTPLLYEAAMIVDQYVRAGAVFELNLSAGTRRATEDRLATLKHKITIGLVASPTTPPVGVQATSLASSGLPPMINSSFFGGGSGGNNSKDDGTGSRKGPSLFKSTRQLAAASSPPPQTRTVINRSSPPTTTGTAGMSGINASFASRTDNDTSPQTARAISHNRTVSDGGVDTPDGWEWDLRHLFDECTAEMIRLLQTNSFNRFRASPLFAQFVHDTKNSSATAAASALVATSPHLQRHRRAHTRAASMIPISPASPAWANRSPLARAASSVNGGGGSVGSVGGGSVGEGPPIASPVPPPSSVAAANKAAAAASNLYIVVSRSDPPPPPHLRTPSLPPSSASAAAGVPISLRSGANNVPSSSSQPTQPSMRRVTSIAPVTATATATATASTTPSATTTFVIH